MEIVPTEISMFKIFISAASGRLAISSRRLLELSISPRPGLTPERPKYRVQMLFQPRSLIDVFYLFAMVCKYS